MTFKDEIKKTIISCNNEINIFSKDKTFKGYALFKKLTKNLEQYFDICEPEDIGQVMNSTYSIWIVSNSEIYSIDYITFNNKKYVRLYEKYRKETGCFEIIAIKKEVK